MIGPRGDTGPFLFATLKSLRALPGHGGHVQGLRALAALPSIAHHRVCRLEVAAEDLGVEQRMCVVLQREPLSQVRQ